MNVSSSPTHNITNNGLIREQEDVGEASLGAPLKGIMWIRPRESEPTSLNP